jgi:hypothetical protein
MRFTLFLMLLLSTSAFAQNAAAPNTASGVDWKTLGRPVDEDTKPMVDRRVYFNTDLMDKNIPVDQAILPQDKVAEWINQHLGQIMTLNGKQYDTQTYNNRVLFTPTGYAEYVVYLKTTNLASFLKDNQYKVAAFVDGSPQVTSQGIEQVGGTNTYSWQVTTKLVLSYLDYRNQPPAALFKDQAKADNRLAVQAKIDLIRIPAQNNGNLVAINHLSFGPVPAATESLDPAPVDE